MSDPERPPSPDPATGTQDGVELEPSAAARFQVFQHAGGLVTPLITMVLAFLVGGLVVLVTTGHNPLSTYQAIFNGAGLGWFLHPGSHSIGVPFTNTTVWFPLNTNSFQSHDAYALQQTLLLTTTLIFTGLAVAFAFRCGLFNIGGQGQYLVGAYFAVWIGTLFTSLDPFLHVTACLAIGALAGALYAGIAGILKATVGAHEVITTIMLNWTAVWVGEWLFGQQGPLQNSTQPAIPISNDIADGAKLPIFWGPKLLQGLSIGIFIALAFLFLYWVVINRTTFGFEVRAVGFNPEAARYSGVSVAKNYFLAMAVSGLFAGLAGALDITGWEYRLGQLDIPASSIGFIGLAAALLGRNTALGILFSSLLFGALINGTSGRQLDPTVFSPDLAGNLTTIIQGLVILFVGLNLTTLVSGGVFRRRRKTT